MKGNKMNIDDRFPINGNTLNLFIPNDLNDDELIQSLAPIEFEELCLAVKLAENIPSLLAIDLANKLTNKYQERVTQIILEKYSIDPADQNPNVNKCLDIIMDKKLTKCEITEEQLKCDHCHKIAVFPLDLKNEFTKACEKCKEI